MVRDGVLEVEMLAPPYTRAAGGSVGGERDEEMAARWESMPNEVIPVSFPFRVFVGSYTDVRAGSGTSSCCSSGNSAAFEP